MTAVESGPSTFDEFQLSLIKKRTRPRVVLLDDASFEIVFAEAQAFVTISRSLGQSLSHPSRLPESIEAAVRRILPNLDSDQSAEEVLLACPGLVVRVSRVSGAAGSFVAVFLEQQSCREHLQKAALAFSLTRREVDVLALILNGYCANEIADRLGIAEGTVSDYFKNLMRKTSAKNRADMVARTLGWSHGADQ